MSTRDLSRCDVQTPMGYLTAMSWRSRDHGRPHLKQMFRHKRREIGVILDLTYITFLKRRIFQNQAHQKKLKRSSQS